MSENYKDELRFWFYNNIPLTSFFFKLTSFFIPTFIPYCGYFLSYKIKKGNIVIDAGSSNGNFSIILSRLVGKNGIVISIEPDPSLCKVIAHRIRKLKYSNVFILNAALGGKDKEVLFLPSSSRIIESADKITKNAIKIEQLSLTSIMKKFNLLEIDYVKMDIEGQEVDVINGNKEFLIKYKPTLIIASYHIINNQQTHIILSRIFPSINYNYRTFYPKHLTTVAWSNK